MAGTVEGGLKAAKKNVKSDPDFYRRIGSIGGRNGTGHAFGHGKVDPREAGRKGGLVKGEGYKAKLDTPEQEFKLPAYQTKKKRFAFFGK